MVAACCRAVSPADVGAAAPARAEVSMWTQLRVADAALQVPACTSSVGEDPSAAFFFQGAPAIPGSSQSIS